MDPIAEPELLFACTHPAIDRDAHAGLLLELVLGVEAGRIATASGRCPDALTGELVAAKRVLHGRGVAPPVPATRTSRLAALLAAIRRIHGAAPLEVEGGSGPMLGLEEEARTLAEAVVERFPDEPEARGLLALLLHHAARHPAHEGAYVPLADQDPGRWDPAHLARADEHLTLAAERSRFGRFQLEAAIASAHARRREAGSADWRAIGRLYAGLVQLTRAADAFVGQAAAMQALAGPAMALIHLDATPTHLVADHQPHWALRAQLLRELGRGPEAHVAFGEALRLTRDPAVLAFLRARRLG
ncbi:MAG: DUF6596 domain-containing protein [Myxococcota bacterium]